MAITQFQGIHRPFSNFWLLRVGVVLTSQNGGKYDSLVYRSVEHAYQAAKSHDMEYRLFVHNLPNPSGAKEAGKMVTLRPDWEDIKLILMTDLVEQKFDNNRELQELLLATQYEELVEGNYHHDNIWGVCFCRGCSSERSMEMPDLGDNWLGKILMNLRGKYRIERGIV